jgi:hypothetical protein
MSTTIKIGDTVKLKGSTLSLNPDYGEGTVTSVQVGTDTENHGTIEVFHPNLEYHFEHYSHFGWEDDLKIVESRPLAKRYPRLFDLDNWHINEENPMNLYHWNENIGLGYELFKFIGGGLSAIIGIPCGRNQDCYWFPPYLRYLYFVDVSAALVINALLFEEVRPDCLKQMKEIYKFGEEGSELKAREIYK